MYLQMLYIIVLIVINNILQELVKDMMDFDLELMSKNPNA